MFLKRAKIFYACPIWLLKGLVKLPNVQPGYDTKIENLRPEISSNYTLPLIYNDEHPVIVLIVKNAM